MHHLKRTRTWTSWTDKCALRDDDFEIEMYESTRDSVMDHDDDATRKNNKLEETHSDEQRSSRSNQVAGTGVVASHRGSTSESTPLIERRALEHVAIDVAEEAIDEGARLRGWILWWMHDLSR